MLDRYPLKTAVQQGRLTLALAQAGTWFFVSFAHSRRWLVAACSSNRKDGFCARRDETCSRGRLWLAIASAKAGPDSARPATTLELFSQELAS